MSLNERVGSVVFSDADPGSAGFAFFSVQGSGSGSWGINLRKNLLKFIAFTGRQVVFENKKRTKCTHKNTLCT